MLSPGQLIRDARRRHGISQRQLALRAGTSQAWISRVERHELSPSVDSLDRLLLVMGERVDLRTERLPHQDHDAAGRAHESMQERLERGLAFSEFADAFECAAGGAHTRHTPPERRLHTLFAHGVQLVVGGGVAALVHRAKRVTRDIAIVPAPDTSNHERLAAALAELEAVQIPAEIEPRELDPTDPRDLSRAPMLLLDTTAGELEVFNGLPYEDLRARAIEVSYAGVTVRVAGLDDLIAMKRAAGRERDLRDIADLTDQTTE